LTGSYGPPRAANPHTKLLPRRAPPCCGRPGVLCVCDGRRYRQNERSCAQEQDDPDCGLTPRSGGSGAGMPGCGCGYCHRAWAGYGSAWMRSRVRRPSRLMAGLLPA
jgi:hypothetical protein